MDVSGSIQPSSKEMRKAHEKLRQALQDLNTRALMLARALHTAEPAQRATMLNRIIELNQLAYEIENCIIQEEEVNLCT